MTIEVSKQSKHDSLLITVRSCVALNVWPLSKDTDGQLHAFYDVRDELSISSDNKILLHRLVIVLPSTL